jgi:acyl-CoA dehydrogenase
MSAIAMGYPPEIDALREGLDGFLRQEVVSRHERHADLLDNERRLFTDEGRYHPDALALIREVRMAAAQAGYYTMCVPTSLGGAGLGHLAWFAGWERIFHRCSEHHWLGHYAISHWAFGPSAVLTQVSERARAEMLESMMAGRASMCFGMSEPGAGSDAMMMKSRAVPDGDGWRLSGSKIWTTNSPYADYCIVFAVTDPQRAAQRRGGISAFLVPTRAPGFVVERVIRMWGSAGGDEAVLHFDDVRIEPWQLVGERDKGFAIAMLGVNLGRLYNSARAVGQSRWALEKALDHVKVREAFGHPIAEYQGVSFPLAESTMQMHAAHLMCLNAARLLDAGLPARKEVAMTKAFATQMGAQAIDRVIQAHGAMGMTTEMGLTEAWQSLRKVNIADGSNEILRRTIFKELLDGDTDW